jgi:hypothetical protein
MEQYHCFTFDALFQEFVSLYLREFGEKKAKEIADKVNSSNKCQKLLIESNRLKVQLGSDDFITTILSSINFSFAKAETVCLASLLLMFRWQLEIGMPQSIVDEAYLRKIFFRIIDKSNKFKAHISSNQNFFEQFLSQLDKKANEFHVREEGPALDGNAPTSRLIIPNIGIDGIRINETTYSQIVRKYGDGYDVINHNNYSYEITYDDLGLSCYYKQDDPSKRIFFIKLSKEFNAYTENGINLGWDRDITAPDVMAVYGPNESYLSSIGSDQAYLKYNGIMFYVDKEDTHKKSANSIYINSIGII